MAWLPDGEKISKIPLFILAQLTNVMDRQTPGDGNSRAMHGIARQKLVSDCMRSANKSPKICNNAMVRKMEK